MQMKVGSMLVKNRVITEAQLEEALRNQVIFGGRIGTNLIELGYLTTETLAEYLCKNKGVPAVTSEGLEDIHPQVLALIPAEIVKKHLVLPISLDKKRLTVAMADPTDLTTADKLSFMTGMYIIPVVIPEILLIMAMERYYKIKRETRYINISKETRRELRTEETPGFHDLPEPTSKKTPTEDIDIIEIPEFNGFDNTDIPDEPEQAPIEIEEDYTLTDMCSSLAGATSRDQIGEALMDYLRLRYFRCALLLPKEASLNGWLAAAEEGYIENFSDIRVEMVVPSSFLQVIETKNFCMGQLLSPTDLKVSSYMGGQDRPAILLPIVLMNRVVAILAVVDSLEGLTRGLNDLQKIAMKSAMAFEILIMRNKIQMV